MKAYTKNKDSSSSLLTVITIFIVFLIPIALSIYRYREIGVFSLWFERNGILIPLSILFGITDIVILIYLLKPPRKYVGKLIKKESFNKGKRECFDLVFEVDEMYLKELECYVKENNTLEVGNKYNIYVKEMNGSIRKIESDIVTEEKEPSKFSEIINHPSAPMNIAILSAGFFVFSLFILSIIGIILYPDYTFYYLIVMAFVVVGLVSSYFAFKKK